MNLSGKLSFIRNPMVLAATMLFLWFCSVVDVLTYMPKRALYSMERMQLSADEKLFELWGGLHTISEELKARKVLGVNVGVPDQEYVERNGFRTPYSHPNYRALAYPGRTVTIMQRENLETLKPNFLILDKNWPEFTFLGDPRPIEKPFVEKPELLPLTHD